MPRMLTLMRKYTTTKGSRCHTHTHFYVTMYDAVVMAILDTLQDLLDTMRRVLLRIELPSNNIIK